MSIPTLQELNIYWHRLSPWVLVDDRDFTPSRLTTFRYYTPFQQNKRNGVYPGEKKALQVVLTRWCETLHNLLLQSEALPLQAMADMEWPRLRTLRLQGVVSIPEKISLWPAILRRMPILRSLFLMIAPQSPDRGRLLMCPSPPTGGPLVPVLEELVVTHPDPQDQFYPCLPPSMRTLILHGHCPYVLHRWGRLSNAILPLTPGTVMPMAPLLASELLAVLRGCRTPHLHTLMVEYTADSEESDLLAFISATFSELRFLRVCRYSGRSASKDDVPPTEHAMVHLDQVDAPPLRPSTEWQGLHYDKIALYSTDVRKLANAMAKELGPTVQTIGMLVPQAPKESGECSYWAMFPIQRRDNLPNREDGTIALNPRILEMYGAVKEDPVLVGDPVKAEG
ncbi:hypothetical protein C8Q77DRAFT_1050862 [Trametes polyzona]|nr:hypothetical protein C8Q77DRAFT_1050862 [Trametes polyzona]